MAMKLQEGEGRDRTVMGLRPETPRGRRLTSAHSSAITEKNTESRREPSSLSMWRRRMPSCCAPIRTMAARERSFNALVLNSTRRHCHRSNAWQSMRYLASVLARVRCHGRPSQVQPISTRRLGGLALPNRVLPITCPVSRHTVANGQRRCRHAARRARSPGMLHGSRVVHLGRREPPELGIEPDGAQPVQVMQCRAARAGPRGPPASSAMRSIVGRCLLRASSRARPRAGPPPRPARPRTAAIRSSGSGRRRARREVDEHPARLRLRQQLTIGLPNEQIPARSRALGELRHPGERPPAARRRTPAGDTRRSATGPPIPRPSAR